MKTRIVEREDVKTIPSLTALHGPKGVLGNQEIGGGLPFCIIEEVCDGDSVGRDECGDADGHKPDPSEPPVQGRRVGGL